MKTYKKQLLATKNIALYTRYVDDILIICDNKNPPAHHQHIHNEIHDNLKLDPTYETRNSINYLDLTITRKQKNLEIDIYRKPTTTDTTINLQLPF